MRDYSQLKVPDLKKLLQERSLVISGNKADLIARLQESDKQTETGTGGEDEIDWDEDDHKATTAPAAAAVAAGGQGQIANPTAVPNQILATDPSKADDLTVKVAQDAPNPDGKGTTASGPSESAAAQPEVPKQDFSAGLPQTDAEKEAEKRAARAKKFGIAEDEEAKKLAERAKKFGIDAGTTLVKGLDSALPERRPKRGREEKHGGRDAKRQTPDRRTDAPKAKVAAPQTKKSTGGVLADPKEKAKAEARAKRFQTAP